MLVSCTLPLVLVVSCMHEPSSIFGLLLKILVLEQGDHGLSDKFREKRVCGERERERESVCVSNEEEHYKTTYKVHVSGYTCVLLCIKAKAFLV